MPHLAIKIVRKNETFQFDGMSNTYKVGDLKAAAILEHGMQSGKASIMFHVKAEGKDVIVETSAEIIHGLNAAITGAEARFAELNTNSNG